MSEFLIVSSTFAREPLLAIALVLGLLVAFGALLMRLQGFAFGAPSEGTAAVRASYLPVFAHLALVLVAVPLLPSSVGLWVFPGCSTLGSGHEYPHFYSRVVLGATPRPLATAQ